MNELSTIDELKEKDEELNAELLKNHLSFARDGAELRSFIEEADHFTGALDRLWAKVSSMQEYNWLMDTALKWQGIYSSILNTPKDIQIHPPPKELKPPLPTGFFSESDLERRIRQNAHKLSITRKLNYLLKDTHALLKKIPSTEKEMLTDWDHAQIEFASQVLDGEIDFVRQIASQSYPRLERIWLREVKHLKAYSIWEGRGGGLDAWHKDSDYFQACDQIREMLVAKPIKKTSFDFKEAKAYLETKYLDKKGRLDPVKAKPLLAERAYFVWEAGVEDLGPEGNHYVGEKYLKMFYENIIPAIIEDDFDKTLTVLEAFEFSNRLGNRYRIINCFEVAVAIYFLNPTHIRKIWAIGQDGKPLPSQKPLIPKELTL